MKANEEWRKDPVRRAAARKLCSDRASLYDKLIKSLEASQITLYQLQHGGEELPTMYRTTSFLSLIEDYKRSQKHYSNPTETLIGNMAAFGKGTNV